MVNGSRTRHYPLPPRDKPGRRLYSDNEILWDTPENNDEDTWSLSDPNDVIRETILVGDFNLLHPTRSGDWVRPDDRSHHILALADQYRLTQHVPRGAVTRYGVAGGTYTESTLDLVWSTPLLSDRPVRCRVREDLDHQSDHYPVEAIFNVNPGEQQPKPSRAWASTDAKVMAEVLAENLPPCSLDVNEFPPDTAIDEWFKEFFEAVADAVE